MHYLVNYGQRPCRLYLTLAQTTLPLSLRLSSSWPSVENWAESWGSLERQDMLQSSSADTYCSHRQLGHQDQTGGQILCQAILLDTIHIHYINHHKCFTGLNSNVIEKHNWDSHAHLHIQSSSMWSAGDITGVEGRWHTLSGCCQTYLSRGTPSVQLKHTHTDTDLSAHCIIQDWKLLQYFIHLAFIYFFPNCPEEKARF